MTKRLILNLILLTAFMMVCPAQSRAQEKTETLEGYVPPPLFGAPRPVPPKKARPKAPKMPQISQPAKVVPKAEKPKKIKAPIAKKRQKKTVIPLKKPEHPKVKFEGTPIEKIPEEKIIHKVTPPITPKITPGPEPIDLLKKKQQEPKPLKKKETPPPPKAKEKPKRATSQGVVKGPKTMPSNKKQSVESEVLFEPKSAKPANLIDRAQKKTKDKNTDKKAVTPPVSQNFTLPNLKNLADGRKQLNLIFAETQDSLQGEQTYTLNQLIIPFLKEHKNARLQLVSYASPQGDSLSGDRRIALSRAMAVRAHITKNGLSANRLDVRSLGAQTDIQPMDRIEIFLINQ